MLHLQDKLEGVLLSALQTSSFPLARFVLGSSITADTTPTLAVAVHLKTTERRASEFKVVPLKAHAGLGDILKLEDRVGRGTGAVRFKNGFLQCVKRVGPLTFGLEVTSDRDSQDGAGAERRVIGRRGGKQERGKLEKMGVGTKENGLRTGQLQSHSLAKDNAPFLRPACPR